MPLLSALTTRLSRRRLLGQTATAVALACLGYSSAHAADASAALPPDVWIGQLSNQVLDSLKADAAIRGGDISRIVTLVDETIMPHVNFRRMTASAVGPGWRQASAAQQAQLQEQFKLLLVHTYAGALRQVKNHEVQVRPLAAHAAAEKELTVRTQIAGAGEPIQLDYRLEQTPGQGSGWKIYDLNVLGVWLVGNYRPQFAQAINRDGVNGLIEALAARNRANQSATR